MRWEFGRYTFELSGQVRHRLGVCGHSGRHVLGQAVNHNHHCVQIMRQGQDLVVLVELLQTISSTQECFPPIRRHPIQDDVDIALAIGRVSAHGRSVSTTRRNCAFIRVRYPRILILDTALERKGPAISEGASSAWRKLKPRLSKSLWMSSSLASISITGALDTFKNRCPGSRHSPPACGQWERCGTARNGCPI